MAHYAQIDKNNTVTQVIVAEQDFIDTLSDKDSWIQTSYNTQGNTHILGGTPLRGNYAGIGYIYDKENDVFYASCKYPSWTISEATNWIWEAPIPYPIDGSYYEWNEQTLSWDKIETQVELNDN